MSQVQPTPAGDDVVVIGAGPAGLTAAYQLAKHGRRSVVLEADYIVGGISRTPERDGWRFDIGGHRFFTKVKPVEDLWHEILPDEDFLLRPRMSRIYYDGKFFDYPLKAGNALRNLGVMEAVLCVLSYVWARIRPPKDQSSLEGWVVARFGWRLYRTFFKTYNEKVWGVPASDIAADWAAQRIKNLSLSKAVINALLPRRNQKEITSLIEEFQYPKFGPGMMWERAAQLVQEAGSEVRMQNRAVRVERAGGRAVAVVAQDREGSEARIEAAHVVSTMPISELIEVISPPAPEDVLKAAKGLSYRDFLTVALVVPATSSFPDNWIYIHAPEVRMGRIQNFGSWSPYMIKEGRTCLGLEYFVFEGDELWNSADNDLIALGTRELEALGLVKSDQVEVGYVVRMPKAYPVYDEGYAERVDVIRRWLEAEVPNVHPVGRNGMHRYNNQDHSMYTAMLSVENIVTGSRHDVWSVNVEEEYHEEVSASSASGGASSSSAGGSPSSGGTGRTAPVLPSRRSEP
ncbi:MAG TPA: NAD(P)/FAD-dependent oxidoreductase [Acidimicrobiales bacterium]|nr:NAD(P)/FAD-dependent oxidoreductase [Acidimicrobiales bacterium]